MWRSCLELVPLGHVLDAANFELKEQMGYTSSLLCFIQIPHLDSQDYCSLSEINLSQSTTSMPQGAGSRGTSDISHIQCQNQPFHIKLLGPGVKAGSKAETATLFCQGKFLSGAALLLLVNET